MSKNEEAILEGNKLVSLNTRIRENVSMEIEKARLMLQMHTNINKITKQSIVELIIMRGVESICEEIDAEYKETYIKADKSEQLEPEIEPIADITEEMTPIVSKSETLEKPIEDGAYLAKRYGTNIINRPQSIDELNLKREEKLSGVDVPNLLRKRATP